MRDDKLDLSEILIVLLFTPVIWGLFGALKLGLFLMGQIIVPISLVWNPKAFWLWDNDENGFRRENFPGLIELYWDRAWRNSVGNSKYALEKVFGDSQDYIQRGKDIDESLNEIQWRYRQVKFLNSIRVAKGDTEIYWGFKIGSKVPGFGFTLQSRPFYLATPLVLFYGYIAWWLFYA